MEEGYQDTSGAGRSIRRIPVSRKPKTGGVFNGISPLGKSGGSGSSNNNYSSRKSPRLGMWILSILGLVILFLIFSTFFSGVKVKVFPKQEAVLIDGTFSAFKNAQSGELSFEVMTITRSLSGEVSATGEEFVEEKASGRIMIFNNYSSAGQKLIKNTRFESPDGRIYRIRDAIVVPGRKSVDGENVPGSIEVTVYADEAGEEYNSDLLDFTIPGLKGDPRFSKFFARSLTPMTGGIKGTVKKASEDDLKNTSNSLSTQLSGNILEEVSSVKPEGFVLLNDSYVIRSSTKTSNGTGDNVLVTEEATFFGIIFNEEELAEFIAENTIASYNDDPVELSGSDNLRVSLIDSDSINFDTVESVSFDLSGDVKIIWKFDENALLDDLKGQSKSDVNAILSRYPGIESAEVIVRPFWTRSIIDNEEKIKLEKIIK